MDKAVLNDKWVKASIIGTIWAASEIVLGSFLHNLKVPFSGNLLTAIAIIIMVSINHVWTEKGLFWRAGLICAIMKTMSPSAIIFGPMIAIFSESLLLEISVRLLGRTFAGYALGGMLAMSWNLFQKIVNFIIFYGFNIVDVYTNLLKYAQKQLNIKADIVWMPIIALLVIFCLFGLLSAVVGIRTGRKILSQPKDNIPAIIPGETEHTRKNHSFDYSIPWLIGDVVLITGGLVLLNLTLWMIWVPATVCIIIVWAVRYRNAVRRLAKPRFWISFVIITMLTAFLFIKAQTGSNSLIEGFLIGLQMNFRAALIIVGFAVLGTELNSPVIRNFFLKTSFKQLPLALELSFESLPVMLANIPDFRAFIRKPVVAVRRFITLAESRLEEMKIKSGKDQKVFILTGGIQQGKTTSIIELIRELRNRNIQLAGIYCPRVMDNSVTTGYQIVDIRSHTERKFLVTDDDTNPEKIGRFSIIREGLDLGRNALVISDNEPCQLVIIDEVGILELDGEGWAKNIDELKRAGHSILMVVRDKWVERVIERWKFKPSEIFNVAEFNLKDASEKITGYLGKS
jgi:nucleoside-triphosphatase THEP1